MMTLNFQHLILFIILFSVDKSQSTNKSEPVSSQNNIAFDLPDILDKLDTVFGQVQLEAYKAVTNDLILQDQKNLENRVNQLFWVSIGNPTLLETANKNSGSSKQVFHYTPNGFYTTVQMLTDTQSELLAKAASRKYNIPVKANQIVHLVLSNFECTIHLYDDKAQHYLLKGKVHDFRSYPLRIDFVAIQNSKEYEIFKKYHENKLDIDLHCSLASSGKQLRVNTLIITADHSRQLGINEKLFGPSHSNNDTVFVTREQLLTLSAELYSTLNIVEEYQIPEFQFKEDFVAELIQQAAVNTFQPVKFEEALKELSKFGRDFSQDLRPDEITKDLGRIFKLETSGNKTHIIVDDEYLESLKESGKYQTSVSANAKYAGISVGGSVSHAKENEKNWMVDKKNLNDQLRDLNTQAKDEVEWQIEGSRIVPKSINVAKLASANFGKTMSFKRVVRHITDAPFQVSSVLYYHKLGEYVDITTALHNLNRKIETVSLETSTFQKSSNNRVDQMHSKFSSDISYLTTSIQNVRNTNEQRLNSLQPKIKKLEDEQNDSRNKIQLLNKWIGGSYCILANGNCPFDFATFHTWLKGIRMYNDKNRQLEQIHAQQFGSSSVRCYFGRDGCDFNGDYVANLELVVCCKK